MINSSIASTWNAAVAEAGTKIKYSVFFNGYTYENAYVYSISKRNCLFSGSPSVGNVMSGELDTEIDLPASIVLPRMSKVQIYMKYEKADGTKSANLLAGTYYIDTRERTGKNNRYRMHAYDAILMMEQPYISSWSSATAKDTTVINDILSQIGSSYINAYPETLPWTTTEAYNVPFTAGTYTMRETISYIAASHMCNVVINPNTNKLQFIPITGLTGTLAGATDLGKHYQRLDTGETHTWTGLEAIIDNEQEYRAGTTTGEVFVLDCPWATQEMADNCFSVIENWTYQPYQMQTAYISPIYYLGDAVSFQDANGNTFSSVIASYDTNSTISYTASIGADYEQEIDHEYAFETKAKREWQRELASTKTSFAVETQAIIGRVETIETTTTGDNMFAYPFKGFAEGTFYGITITDLADGRIQINGTATASFNIYIENRQRMPAGTYTFSGGASTSPLYGYAYDTETATSGTYLGWDRDGSGRTFTITESKWIRFFYQITNGNTCDNVILSPMLARGNQVQEWRSPVATQTSQVVINAGNIESKVSQTDYNGNTIASLINQSATTVQIQAAKINLTGYITASSLQTAGSTVINGANISTGNIKVGGSSGNTNGAIYVYDSSDNLLVRLNKDGLYLGTNQFISCSKLYGGTISLGGADNGNGQLTTYNASGNKLVDITNQGIALYDSASHAQVGLLSVDSANGTFVLTNQSLGFVGGSTHIDYGYNSLKMYQAGAGYNNVNILPAGSIELNTGLKRVIITPNSIQFASRTSTSSSTWTITKTYTST